MSTDDYHAGYEAAIEDAQATITLYAADREEGCRCGACKAVDRLVEWVGDLLLHGRGAKQ